MAHKFSDKIIEKWGITERAILKSSDYLLYSYWSWKQKDLSSVLIFPPYSEGSQAALVATKNPAKLFCSWFKCCETLKVALSFLFF